MFVSTVERVVMRNLSWIGLISEANMQDTSGGRRHQAVTFEVTEAIPIDGLTITPGVYIGKRVRTWIRLFHGAYPR